MRSIYSKARTVLCWLGEARDDSDLGISFLRGCQHGPDVVVSLKHTDPTWDSVLSFIHRPYWTRIWIIQENELAQRCVFLCGNEEIEGRQLFMAFDNIHLAQILIDPTMSGHPVMEVIRFYTFRLGIRNIMRESKSPGLSRIKMIQLLNDLMIETSSFDATDSRDRLYGLLGLLNPRIHQLVQLDYTKSAALVFAELALLTFEAQFGMIAQSGIGHPRSYRAAVPDMPSWVPSYQGVFIEELRGFERHTCHKAGGSESPLWRLITGTMALRVGVVRTDSVVSVFAPKNMVGPRLVSWACQTAVSRVTKHPCGSWRRAFYRTVLLDLDYLYFPSPKTQDESECTKCRYHIPLDATFVVMMQEFFESHRTTPSLSGGTQGTSAQDLKIFRNERAYWDKENERSQLNDLHSGKELEPDYQNLPAGLDETLLGLRLDSKFRTLSSDWDRKTKSRTFMIFKNGRMGLGPIGAQSGDEVVVVPGCPVPLVIRRQGNEYKVVGDAHIWGLMEGQVFEGRGTQGPYIQDIVLR